VTQVKPGGSGTSRYRVARRSMTIAVAAAVVVSATAAATPLRAQSPRIGRPAPGFTLPTLAGDSLALARLRGHPVLLSFWATWCTICRTEMPDLALAGAAHAADGLTVVAINADDAKDAVARYLRSFPAGSVSGVIHALDPTNRIVNRYRVPILPSAVFIDSAGIVRAIHHGAMTRAEIAAGLRAILPDNSQE